MTIRERHKRISTHECEWRTKDTWNDGCSPAVCKVIYQAWKAYGPDVGTLLSLSEILCTALRVIAAQNEYCPYCQRGPKPVAHDHDCLLVAAMKKFEEEMR